MLALNGFYEARMEKDEKNYKEAASKLRQSLMFSWEGDDVHWLPDQYEALSICCQALNQYEQAKTSLEEGIKIARSTGQPALVERLNRELQELHNGHSPRPTAK